MISELPIKSSARRKFGSVYSNLQAYKDLQEPTQIYKTHHITGHASQELTKCQQVLESEQCKRNNVHHISSNVCRNSQAMLLHPEHPALPMGNPVTPSFHEKGTTPVRQLIANSSRGVTHPSFPAAARSAKFQQ